MAGVVLALLCVLFMLSLVLGAAVLLFRLACAMAGVTPPGVLKAAGIVGITFVILSIAEGVMAATVRGVYVHLDYPLWEAGVVAFFVGLPIDLVLASAVHAGLLRIGFGRAVQVWFAHRLILLSIVLAAAGVIAVAVLASNR